MHALLKGPDNPNYTRFGPLHGFNSVFPPALTRGQKNWYDDYVRCLLYTMAIQDCSTVRKSMIHAATDVAHRRKQRGTVVVEKGGGKKAK